jgi:hypothetical protein
MHALILEEESIILKNVRVFDKLFKISKYMFMDSKKCFPYLKYVHVESIMFTRFKNWSWVWKIRSWTLNCLRIQKNVHTSRKNVHKDKIKLYSWIKQKFQRFRNMFTSFEKLFMCFKKMFRDSNFMFNNVLFVLLHLRNQQNQGISGWLH